MARVRYWNCLTLREQILGGGWSSELTAEKGVLPFSSSAKRKFTALLGVSGGSGAKPQRKNWVLGVSFAKVYVWKQHSNDGCLTPFFSHLNSFWLPFAHIWSPFDSSSLIPFWLQLTRFWYFSPNLNTLFFSKSQNMRAGKVTNS